jgi:hypothetical protein
MPIEVEEVSGQRELDATEEYGGTQVTIEPTGDYSIDTTGAQGVGNMTVRLKAGATLKVELGGNLALRIEDLGGWLRVELGGSADQRLVLGDKLMELLNRFFENAYDMHIHPTPMGPSGPPLPAFTGGRIDESVLSEIVYTK